MAGLLPGEILDKTRVELFRRRLMGLGYFMHDQNGNKQIKIEIVNRRPKDQPYGDLMNSVLGDVTQARGQDPGLGDDLVPAPAGQPGLQVPSAPAQPTVPDLSPFGATNPFGPPADTPPLEVPQPTPMPPPRGPGGPVPFNPRHPRSVPANPRGHSPAFPEWP